MTESPSRGNISTSDVFTEDDVKPTPSFSPTLNDAESTLPPTPGSKVKTEVISTTTAFSWPSSPKTRKTEVPLVTLNVKPNTTELRPSTSVTTTEAGFQVCSLKNKYRRNGNSGRTFIRAALKQEP